MALALTEGQIAAAYRRYGHLVLRRCRYVMRSEALGEDALQEVFVRLMKYGAAFAEAEAPVRWLYRVADRVCFDMLAKLKKQPLSDEQEPLDTGPTGNPAKLAADRDILVKFFGRFDDTIKQLAMLYYVDGLTQEQIAAEIGWSRVTVNKKLAWLAERAAALKKPLGVH